MGPNTNGHGKGAGLCGIGAIWAVADFLPRLRSRQESILPRAATLVGGFVTRLGDRLALSSGRRTRKGQSHVVNPFEDSRTMPRGARSKAADSLIVLNGRWGSSLVSRGGL